MNALGSQAVPNADVGIVLSNASDNTIGGLLGPSVAGSRNIISGNLLDGILLANTCEDNQIRGNLIGTDATGSVQLGNTADGVFLLGGEASGVTVGGLTESSGSISSNTIIQNVISGNSENGIEIFGGGATRNSVSGNTIGLGLGGESAIGNAANGVYLNDAGSGAADQSNLIGPANVISGNEQTGVMIFGTSGGGGYNQVEGNIIGTDATGTKATYPDPKSPADSLSFGNGGNGVFIYGTSDNTIGGMVSGGVPGGQLATASPVSNLISNNAESGVAIFSPSQMAIASGNVVEGNLIGTDGSGSVAVGSDGKALGNKADGVDIYSGENNTIGEPGAFNVISGNLGNGVLIAKISDVSATGNVLDGNYIGIGSNGMTPVANGQDGVLVENASSNSIGVAGGSQRVIAGTLTNIPQTPSNVISGNLEAGIQFLGISQYDSVLGDYIGVSPDGLAPNSARSEMN